MNAVVHELSQVGLVETRSDVVEGTKEPTPKLVWACSFVDIARREVRRLRKARLGILALAT